MARIFIDTLEEGLRLSRTNAVSKDEFKALQKEERKELAEKAVNAQTASATEKAKVSDADKQTLVDTLQKNINQLDAVKVKELVGKYGINFKDVSTISDEAYNELKGLL